MKRPYINVLNFFILILIVTTGVSRAHANQNALQPHVNTKNPNHFINVAPPHIASTSHILIDANSGKILAKKDINVKRPPASLTKMMTVYVVSNAIKAGQISLDDKVTISKKAWHTPGSKMFIKQGQRISIKLLLQGIIVDSGNDACVAMAEYIAGNEKNFAVLMNKQAKVLGMKNTKFTDSTGLPDKNLYSTAKDLAILARAIIKDFPENYHWFKQKWFSFNGIKQPNRNRLLWRNPLVDGIKTGHTQSAGHAIVASAINDQMRLITVILGAPSDQARSDGGQRLLNYGFRFYETHKLYPPMTKISNARIWKGTISQVDLGVKRALYLTIPTGSYHNIEISTSLTKHLEAPISKGQQLGQLIVKLNNKIIAKRNLISLDPVTKGGIFARLSDSVRLSFKKLIQ